MNNQDFSQCRMAQLIYQKLADYCPILDESSQISSLLDPRVKLSAFKDDIETNKAKDLILGLNGYFSTSASTSDSTTVSANEIINARNYFRKLRNCNNNNNNNTSTSSTANVNIQGELNRYLAMPLEDQIDPLIWWQAQQQGFPILSKIARDYLCIQATSIASEQAFSIAGQIISPLRNRLESETARATLCLKSWFRQDICKK